MAAGLQVTTGATGEPITTSAAKTHLRVASTAENTLIDNLITSSRLWFETQTNVTSMDRTYNYTLDDFPSALEIELPRTPLASTSVTVTYRPSSGGSTTVDSTKLIVDDQSPRPRVALKRNESWPDSELQEVNGVEVQFTAGFGTSGGSSTVPQMLKQGILLLTGHWFEHREGATIRGSVSEMPMAVQSIVWNYKLPNVP